MIGAISPTLRRHPSSQMELWSLSSMVTSYLASLVEMMLTSPQCNRKVDEKRAIPVSHIVFLGSIDIFVKLSVHFLGLIAGELAFFTTTYTTRLTVL